MVDPRMKSNLTKEFLELNNQKNAVILVHNYQLPEIQDIGDYIGDSFGLAQKAMKTDADIIVFCGVDFMAESAKILNPDKIIIHPDSTAICPMAAMVDVESLIWMKRKYADAAVVSYVNTTAEVKAESDICVTSSNAVDIINKIEEETIVFIPDSNLGTYVQRFIDDKDIILWPGICPTHHKIKKHHILTLKNQHPSAELLVHPECNPEIIDIADYVLSTQGIVNHVDQSDREDFIIGTERDLCYRLSTLYPEKMFHSVDTAVCPNMKKITLHKVFKSLKDLRPRVNLSDRVITKASMPLERMIMFGRGD
jgi:quinolinate synthase